MPPCHSPACSSGSLGPSQTAEPRQLVPRENADSPLPMAGHPPEFLGVEKRDRTDWEDGGRTERPNWRRSYRSSEMRRSFQVLSSISSPIPAPPPALFGPVEEAGLGSGFHHPPVFDVAFRLPSPPEAPVPSPHLPSPFSRIRKRGKAWVSLSEDMEGESGPSGEGSRGRFLGGIGGELAGGFSGCVRSILLWGRTSESSPPLDHRRPRRVSQRRAATLRGH